MARGLFGLVCAGAVVVAGCRSTPHSSSAVDASPAQDAPDAADASPADAAPPDAAPVTPAFSTDLAAGARHTCAIIAGKVRCWGNGDFGKLGTGDTNQVGQDQTAGCAALVDFSPASAVQVTAGGAHTCALLDTGDVYCWGGNDRGQLGHPGVTEIGDGEPVTAFGPVDVGGRVVQIDAGRSHTCAVLEGGAVRCWGGNQFGQLGYGNTIQIGDDETPASAGDVDVGGPVVQVSAGGLHTCALLAGGAIRCWGQATYGQLGYGNTIRIGDDETPASAGDVDIGGPATAVALGTAHTCAVRAGGAVTCWGRGGNGLLGYGNQSTIGDDEVPASAGVVDVGGPVARLALGGTTCAVLTSGGVRCWGLSRFGALGYPLVQAVGDDETPASMGDIDTGAGAAEQIAAGSYHTCASFASGAVRCWGLGDATGYGHLETIGDDEPPATAGDLPLATCAWPIECANPVGPACTVDPYEPNDTSAGATSLTTAITDGFLCTGDEDWYHVTAPHGLARMQYQVLLVHDSLSFGCSICDLGDLLASCPSHTVSVDVLDAQTGALLATHTRARGFARIDRVDRPVTDLLIRVHGIAGTSFGYKLRAVIKGYDTACDGESCDLPAICDHCRLAAPADSAARACGDSP